MKIVYQADIHLRDAVPANRIDDYDAAQFGKFNQLIDFANAHKAILLLGGDLYDRYRISPRLLNTTMEALFRAENPVFSTLGQHDVPYHQMDLEKSPVLPLYICGALSGLGVDGYDCYGDLAIHYCGWEQKPTTPIKGRVNILLGHISVFEGSVPHYWKGEGYTEKTLKKQYPGFDYYLCGDIHSPLCQGNVIVSGSMMRMGIDQLEYKPRCYLIDTDTGEIKPLFYEISDEVFNIKELEIAANLNLDNLIKAMQKSARLKASYKTDCLQLADKTTRPLMQEIFDELDQ